VRIFSFERIFCAAGWDEPWTGNPQLQATLPKMKRAAEFLRGETRYLLHVHSIGIAH
jgi:hypothetical protein